MMGLTKRQSEALAFIQRFYADHGYSPSGDELMADLGLKSKSGSHRLLHGLRERGAIDFLDGKKRSIVVLAKAAA